METMKERAVCILSEGIESLKDWNWGSDYDLGERINEVKIKIEFARALELITEKQYNDYMAWSSFQSCDDDEDEWQ